jgi:sterol desaturase/sphingolipid hydroxylase (fatty acid hydroxylase superfamily)
MASSNTIMVLCSIGLLLDLIGAYLVHFVEHKTKFLWRFHLIHHTDTWVDTTSANRHHPGESIIRFTFTTLGVLSEVLCG